MATKPTNKEMNTELHITPLRQQSVTLRMIGSTPLYFNSMSAKAKRDLLIGAQRKTAAQKKTIKHNPEEEFRSSVYEQDKGDTLLCFPAAGVKAAMAQAAVETDGIKKTTVQKLVFMPQQHINIWGKPYLKMDVVRSADINKTPDIRTRAFLPNWAAEIDVKYIHPALSVHSVVNLLQNAGAIIGIGDYRQEKGKGGFGSFNVGTDKDEEFNAMWKDIVLENRAVQEEAMANPVAYDKETATLMKEIKEERVRRDQAA